MARIRVLGPRTDAHAVIRALQDLELVHVDEPEGAAGVEPAAASGEVRAELDRVRSALEPVEAALARLPEAPETGRADAVPAATDPVEAGRRARHLARLLERLAREEERLAREAAELVRYRGLFEVLVDLPAAGARRPGVKAYHLLLEEDAGETVEALRTHLTGIVGDGFDLVRVPGEAPLLVLLVPEADAGPVEELLGRAGIRELPLPEAYAGLPPRDAGEALSARLAEIRQRRSRIHALRRRASRRHRGRLRELRRALRDRELEMEAAGRVGATRHAFVLEGWVPAAELAAVEGTLEERFGDRVVVERVATERWRSAEAPVVLENPRIFRPFEAITRLLPLPRYGSIDPTPFVAVFFPMFFGLILGDIGYGAVLAGAAALLHLRSEPDATLRSVAEIAGACAAFTIVFGFVYGELLGDLGHRWLGLDPLVFERGEALVPFLGLAVALGVVHILLGLVLGAMASFRDDPRASLGRGLSAVMVVLILVAILAATRVLPASFFSPAVVALLVAFVALVAAEGVLGAVEFFSTLGNVLSYARIMAIGTASVFMAVVANRLAGTVGSVLVGALFGLLFHLVNFALGIFGPTVHGLRLHYVEFFGKFYSPGGERYRPLAHWRPDAAGEG